MRLATGLSCTLAALAAVPAHAIVITPSQETTALISALLGGGGTGIAVTSVTLNGHRDTGTLSPSPELSIPYQFTSSGTYTNASAVYGIGSGVVLSTGGVEGVSDPTIGVIFPGYGDGSSQQESNSWAYGTVLTFPPSAPVDGMPGRAATAAQETLLDPITATATENYDHFDVTELIIDFDMQSGYDRVNFSVVFGSEEYEEFVGSSFIDGFGMYLNGANIAFVNGQPVNINHPAMAAVAGTELDGVLAPNGNPVLTFSGAANPTANQLRFILADTSDGVWDSTVYFSSLEGVPQIPAPPALWLALTAAGACAPLLKKRRSV